MDTETRKILKAAIRDIGGGILIKDVIEGRTEKLDISKLKTVKPFKLKSGFKVGYSIDEINPDLKYEHISISSSSKDVSDYSDSDIIADRLLGKGWEYLGSLFNKNVIHYRKKIEE